MRAMLLYATPAAIAVGIAISPAWMGWHATKTTYRLVFCVALVGLAITFLRPEIEMSFDGNHGSGILVVLLALAALVVPFILLIEAGVTGYKGFSSWVRYLLLCLTVLGGVGLLASLLVPRFLRR